jgi:tetratricopeptide (TPR) repeat protein
MKSRVWIVAIMMTLVTAQAYGAFTETSETVTEHSAWQKVKVTVKQWWNDWNRGDLTAAKPSPVVAKTKPATPAQTGTGTTAASAPATTGTATAAAPATVAPATGTGTGTGTTTAKPVAAAPAKPVKPADTEAHAALRKQPLYEQSAAGSSLKDVQSVRDSVKGSQLLGVAKPGRAGTSKLPRSKQGVPTYDLKQIKVSKRIPRLDIGTENLISRNDFKVSKLNWGLSKPSDMKPLPSPKGLEGKEIKTAFAIKPAKVLGSKGLTANMKTVGQPISRESIDKIQYTVQPAPDVKPLPVKILPDEHLKMVAALILFEKGNSCHIIMGLFNQLAAAEKTKSEANYHLGACADQLQMHQAAFDRLSYLVATEDKEFAKDALKLLAKDLPIIYERDFYKTLNKAKAPKQLITEESRDDVTYRYAKGAYRAGDHKGSIVYADQVSEKAEFHDDARFLSAMNSFALGDKANALRKLEGLWQSIEARKMGNSNIRALTSVNLARMYFAQKKYDKALEHYMQVPKDHSLWVAALIEQGWTQLAIEDYSGAIGNMYSLHSPYFKAVYQPESFVVRTIGYLNICQYGDAYKTLSWLEKDYREWFVKTDEYLTSHKKPMELYNTVKTYIKSKSDTSVEGVPYQVWREVARRKDFLNLQTALNDKQDETKRYEGVNEKIKTEKAGIRTRSEASKRRFDEWRAKIARVKVDKSLAKNMDEYNAGLKREKEATMGYRFQLAILEQSRQGYLDFQKKGQSKLDSETVALSTKAGEVLLKRATAMRSEMNRVLENNEFLRYEVFSGSGENIRYQVAGGEVSGTVNRVPAHVRPTKMMNWSFDGEFWEDEIGSYRSSLQNNCPAAAGSPGRQEGDHAQLDNGN